MTAFHTSGGGVKYAWHKAFAYFRLILPWMGKVPKADGVIQLTLSNPSSSLALSLAVYKFISLAGFTCRLGKAEQLPLLWGGRSCVSIANYRFGEGVHPVREISRHSEEQSDEESQLNSQRFFAPLRFALNDNDRKSLLNYSTAKQGVCHA